MGCDLDVQTIFGVAIRDAKEVIGKSHGPLTTIGVDDIKRQNSELDSRVLSESSALRGNPRISMSLGLSSSSIRLPFASPGPIAPTAQKDSFSYSLSQSDHTNPRTLFDMSTPGETPTVMLDQIGPHHQRHSVKCPDAFADGGRVSPNPTPENNVYLQSDSHVFSSGIVEGSLYSACTNMDSQHRVRISDDTVDELGSRRVSFGPTARLSFSSMRGGGNEKYDSGYDGETVAREESISHQRYSKRGRMRSVQGGRLFGSSDESFLVSPILHYHETPHCESNGAEIALMSKGEFQLSSVDTNPSTEQRFAVDVNGFEKTATSKGDKCQTDSHGSGKMASSASISDWVTSTASSQQLDEHRSYQLMSKKTADSKKSCVHSVSCLLTVLATAYNSLKQFRCDECIDLLHSLPVHHFSTGWVLNVVGRAHLASNRLHASLQAFKDMQRIEPHRVKGLEMLSTVLHLLNRSADLSCLAQQV